MIQLRKAKDKTEIDLIIKNCDVAFESPVSERTIYPSLLEKIYKYGNVIYAWDEQAIGYCAFYVNDSENKNAYITLIAVNPIFQKMHIGKQLLNGCLQDARKKEMKNCLLEVNKNNSNAIRFYRLHGFQVIENREETYLMKKTL